MSYTKQQRIQNVKKWSESTLTRIAFCNKEGISTDSLRSWIYDLIGEDKNWWMKMSESDKKKDLSRRLEEQLKILLYPIWFQSRASSSLYLMRNTILRILKKQSLLKVSQALNR